MRADYRVTPWMAWVFSVLVLAFTGVLLADIARDTVAHVTADDQPATIVDIERVGARTGSGNRREELLTFELRDGTISSDQVEGRLLWWPSKGDTVHVHEVAPGDWEVSEDFSWLRAIGGGALLLLPWLVLLAKVWEWGEKTFFPERWAASQERERARRRAYSREVRSRTGGRSRRQRPKDHRPRSS